MKFGIYQARMLESLILNIYQARIVRMADFEWLIRLLRLPTAVNFISRLKSYFQEPIREPGMLIKKRISIFAI